MKKIRRQFEEWMPLVAYMIGPGGARCRDRFRAHESLVKVIRLPVKVKLDLMPKMSQSDIRAVAVVENGPGGSLQRGSSTSARAVSGRLTVGGSARPSRNDYFSMRGTKRTEELARHEG